MEGVCNYLLLVLFWLLLEALSGGLILWEVVRRPMQSFIGLLLLIVVALALAAFGILLCTMTGS